MDLKLLTQADFTLSKCGRLKAPPGLSLIPVNYGIPINAIIPNQATQTFVKEIGGDTNWYMESITATTSANLYVQIELPNGRFLFANLLLDSTWAGYGSFRYLLTEPLECPPGSKIQVTLDTTITNPGATQNISMVFDGAYYYLLRGGMLGRPTLELVSEMKRYYATPAQNIIAPCWAQGFGPAPPPGCQDTHFIYDSSVATSSVTAGPFTNQVFTQIEQDADFVCRRFLFDVTRDNTVTAGVWLARIRAGSGYAFNDEYFDVAKYIGGAYHAKGWTVRNGDKVLVDLQLVDGAGTGNMNFTMYMDGTKRKKRAA